MVNGQDPDEGPVNILGRKFLAIRGDLPCSSDGKFKSNTSC